MNLNVVKCLSTEGATYTCIDDHPPYFDYFSKTFWWRNDL